jgi:inositol-1,3,4-trisphosphate 5/6-kinase/inositol-tetrakisphosphate 1-kinase
MAVAMTPRGLVDLASTRRLGLGEGDGGRSRSFLCQEYSNHDEALYKVYVLGSHVSVHKRRSLPNLPADPAVSSSLEQERAGQTLGIMPGPRLKDLVEFDSQRPYPRFSDFLDAVSGNGANSEGDVFAPGMNRPHVAPLESIPQRLLPPVSSPQQGWAVTAEEVGPVVDVLRTAFGLDLFGFDVLVATTRLQPEACEWLVVDVNYFPSYKEVSSFPSLLARYLTQRALQERTRKLQQRQVQDAGDGEPPEPR